MGEHSKIKNLLVQNCLVNNFVKTKHHFLNLNKYFITFCHFFLSEKTKFFDFFDLFIKALLDADIIPNIIKCFQNRIFHQYFKETDIEMEYIYY